MTKRMTERDDGATFASVRQLDSHTDNQVELHG